MDRERLDGLSYEQLRDELIKLKLPVTASRTDCLDRLLTYYERYYDCESGAINEVASGSQTIARPSQSVDNVSSVRSATTMEEMQQSVTFIMQQMQRQQQLIERIANAVTSAESGTRNAPPSTSVAPTNQQSPIIISSSSVRNSMDGAASMDNNRHINVFPPLASVSPAQAVKLLANQISVFSGTEDDDVEVWIRKVERVASIHGVQDGVTLLAASSKLTKNAREWFDLDDGQINDSWFSFKNAIIKRFKRYVPFHVLMQKVESRKWNFPKESFHDYALQKMKLMNNLQLPDRDRIQLIINGINSLSLRSTAAAIRTNSMDDFLEQMGQITSSCAINVKKSPPPVPKKERIKTPVLPTTESSSQSTKNNSAVSCVYCKAIGHVKADCFKLRKKNQSSSSESTSASASVAAPVTQKDNPSQVGCVLDNSVHTSKSSNSIVEISSINGSKCSMFALIDTGSPVSFMLSPVYKLFFGQNSSYDKPVIDNLITLNDTNIKVLAIQDANISLSILPHNIFNVQLRIVDNDLWSTHVVLGRDFISNNDLSLLYKPNSSNESDKLQLFKEVASADFLETNIKKIAFDTDFGINGDQKINELIEEVQNTPVAPINDEYSVKVRLKDDSIFAYAPRRFAHTERLEIREIIDDLLKRAIIKPSNSCYCARVVPIRKKNKKLRLCVDLRPLNDRVIKQKFPFPVIEDLLSRLGNAKVFTLIDLKDGFHLIKIHPDSTKFFSFATPDGQYEYLRLPFGYCESPAEFQKRIYHILQPLIREDKILVYIDDILIPSETVEDNLIVLKQTMLLLKKYEFEINFEKSQFLKHSIEFLGYTVSPTGITLSERHVEAIRRFPVPKSVIELQRFLGLVNFFRRFIKDLATKAKPLHSLLKKNSEFKFDDKCVEAFEQLKSDLLTYPVLRPYQPHLYTELHTDASSIALAAILLQKQDSGALAPVAYYSQSTNEAESKYHSFELEMLAIVKATERFHIYLAGIPFKVVTDCNSLVHAVNKASINPRVARWILRLQNYTFSIVHRSGQKMTHVDALSRIVASTEIMPLEKELQFRQLADPNIKIIAQQLEKSVHHDYDLIDGLVYKKESDGVKFVVPEGMIHKILYIYHDESAHCGTDKTFQGIHVHYWFPAMRRKIKSYVSNCVTCLMASASHTPKEGELQITPTANHPFQIMHTDHFGPLPESRNGMKHILLLIDSCTRFTWLFPVKSTTTREVVKHFSLLFDNYGNPNEIVSDRGTAFSSSEFVEFLRPRGIKHRLVAVASPWANGMVERVNRFLKASLKKVVEDPIEWSNKLVTIQYVINNTFHASTKASPSKLLLGYEMKNHSDSKLVEFLTELAKTETSKNEELPWVNERDTSRKLAIQATDKIKEYNKTYYDRSHKAPKKFKAGEYVRVKDDVVKPGESKKLKSDFKGPYMIDKVLPHNRYVVKDIPGFNITSRPYNSILSPDRLRHWIKPVVPL